MIYHDFTVIDFFSDFFLYIYMPVWSTTEWSELDGVLMMRCPCWWFTIQQTEKSDRHLCASVTYLFALTRLLKRNQKLVSLKSQTKAPSSMFCFVQSEKETTQGPERNVLPSLCCSPAYCDALFSFILLSLQGQKHLKKDCTLVSIQQKLSAEFHPLWICVWITQELQIKICWTPRVRSWDVDHRSFQGKSPWGRGRVAATLTDGYRDWGSHLVPDLLRPSPCLCQILHIPPSAIYFIKLTSLWGKSFDI